MLIGCFTVYIIEKCVIELVYVLLIQTLIVLGILSSMIFKSGLAFFSWPRVHKAFQSQDQDVKKITLTFLKPIFYLTIDCWYSIKYVLQNYTSQNSKPFFIIEKVNFIVATVTTM